MLGCFGFAFWLFRMDFAEQFHIIATARITSFLDKPASSIHNSIHVHVPVFLGAQLQIIPSLRFNGEHTANNTFITYIIFFESSHPSTFLLRCPCNSHHARNVCEDASVYMLQVGCKRAGVVVRFNERASNARSPAIFIHD